VNSNQKNLTKHQKNIWQMKKQTTPHKQGRRGVPPQDVAKNNKQKPPNTLLSSQTTHPTSLTGRATNPAAFAAC
jgi:hypothetical protein